LPLDAAVERVLLDTLAPDQIALAVTALRQLDAATQLLEQQWALKRERARYEAERARRQYDTVEPENRLVARSLERVWEEKLRQLEAVAQAYETWRREQGTPLGVRGPANSPPEAGSNRHLRPVNSPPLTAGTEPLGEAEPSLTNNPIWQA